jgi:hypothetical protein
MVGKCLDATDHDTPWPIWTRTAASNQQWTLCAGD